MLAIVQCVYRMINAIPIVQLKLVKQNIPELILSNDMYQILQNNHGHLYFAIEFEINISQKNQNMIYKC